MIQIDRVTDRQIATAVRRTLRSGLHADILRDFLAGIDWSTRATARPGTIATLSNLEGWTTAFDEGDLPESQFVSRLSALLQFPKTRQHLSQVSQ
ncbi:MAG: hypothetical protein IT303_01355 [Dehalococcoidia bacterium]|nr:hypothetical protein [Dehalococcoidia bacterium]